MSHARHRQTPPERIAFLINSMEGGGAERAMANLLHHLLPHLAGRAVELILLDNLPRVQSLPPGLVVRQLDARGSMMRSARQLAAQFARSRPDVCVSFLARANCLNVALAARFGHRAIISERVQTSAHLAGARRGWLFRRLTRLLYPHAAAVVPVSQGVAEDLARNFGVSRARMAVIGNPIDATDLHARAAAPPEIALPARFILAVGRLVVNKNFPMLLAAYAQARPRAELVILGEGPERAALGAQIARLGLSGRVHLPGFVPNPYPVMARAEYLVSCSNAEGFPNTLIEAMTLGCAVVATDCPSGPAEVLGGQARAVGQGPVRAAHGILLAPGDVAALAEAMVSLENPELRAAQAACATARARDFGTEEVLRQYLALIDAPAPARAAPARKTLLVEGD